MSGSQRWGRRGQLARVGEVLPPSVRPRGRSVDWAGLVGDALAEVTALVGVTAEGTIRVAAANDAACAEILARAPHVIAAFNGVARRVRARQARDLEAWVAREFRPQTARRAAPRRAPREPGAEALAQAAAEVGAVVDDGVRAALVRARAAAIEARRDAPRGGDPSD